MPLRDFECQTCHSTQERLYKNAAEYPLCQCGGELTPLPLSFNVRGKTGVFPFVSTHIDGQGNPVTVESIQHLRRIEKQYGVVLSAFSQDRSRELDGIRDLPKHRPGGRDYYDR